MSKPVIAEAWVGMLPSMDGFERGLSAGIGSAAGTAGVAGGTAYSGAFLGAAKKFILPGLAVLGGAALFQGLASFAQGAIEEASTLDESVNAVNVVFGEAADSVLALGDNSANSIGLASSELNAYAVQFSGFAKTVAGDGGDVASTLDDLTTRGADFASVMDLDVGEALGLFQSGLAGETEPLRRYGVFLDAATVSAYAAANGIGETGRELTEAEKVQARYGALMEQTSITQGDFANTSDSLAVAQRRLDAQWVDIQATLGTALIPVAEIFVGILADSMPIVAQVAGLFADLFGALFEGEDAGAAFEEFLRLIQPSLDDMAVVFAEDLVPVMRDMGRTFAEDLLPVLVEAAPDLANLVALGVEMFTVFARDLLPILVAVGTFLATTLVGSFRGVSAVIGWAVDLFRSWSTKVGENIESIKAWFSALPENIKSALSSIANTITAPFKKAFNAVAGLWNKSVGSLGFTFPDWVPGMGSKGFDVPNIPLLANGGIVTRPTLAMIGEGGQSEAVVPLDRAGDFGFGGLANGEIAHLLREVRDELKRGHTLVAEGATIARTSNRGNQLLTALGVS